MNLTAMNWSNTIDQDTGFEQNNNNHESYTRSNP